VYKRGTWGEALLAALPSILLAVVALSLSYLINFDERVILSLLIVLAIAFPAVAIYSWWKGIPIWSYPWLGVGSLFAPILGVLLLSFVVSTTTGVPMRQVWSSPPWQVLGPLPFYGPIILIIVLLFLQRGWHAPSCAALSWVGTMVLSFQEEVFQPQRLIFIVAVCLFWAVAAALFVIGPRRLKALGLAGGIGTLIAADAIARWRYALPGNRPTPSHELILLALFLLEPALAMAKRRKEQLARK
jgi:hypothetical protein